MRRLIPLLLGAVLAPTGASAESPKFGTFELRFASYRPDIDAEFNGTATPFAKFFGEKRRVFPKILASYTLLDQFVQVDVGLGTGWYRAKGHAYESDGVTPSPDSTAFNIVPATLALTVRLDGLAERWPIPFDVYGRVALERYAWWVTGGGGGMKEKGATNGWSWAAGAGLLLDFLDPMLSRELDNDSGVNHTWLYFEVEKSTVDDFGSTRSWILSDERLTLAGGLRMVF